MARPRLPRDPNGRPIDAKLDAYLQARQMIRESFPDLMKQGIERAMKGETALLSRLLEHLEDQPSILPGASADSNSAELAERIAKWAAVGGLSVKTARQMIALLNETGSFVKRNATVDALIAAHENAGLPVPERVHALRDA